MTTRPMGVVLALLGVAALSMAGCNALSDEGCMGGGEATVAKYEDCQRLCKQGDRDACNRRSEVEGGLSQACHKRGVAAACKALCYGRKRNQAACGRLRELSKSN